MAFHCGPRQGQIISSGSILYLDALNPNSYPGSGSTWYDLSGNNAHGTIINGTTWNSSGYFSFDGIDDGVDGVNVPQNYVDLMVGMYSLGSSGTGIEMVFAKYNDFDKSFRTISGAFRHSGLDANDWNYLQTSYDNINGISVTGNNDLVNSWNIVRLVNQNTTFSPPFVYSISSDFLNRRYKGNISFILCYDRILSTQEVIHNYDVFKRRFDLI